MNFSCETELLGPVVPVHTSDKVEFNIVEVDEVEFDFDNVALLSLSCRKSTVAGSFNFKARYDVVPSDVVSTLSLVRTNWRQRRTRQLVAVDVVAKVEHVQLGLLCRRRVILSPESLTFFRHSVDFV